MLCRETEAFPTGYQHVELRAQSKNSPDIRGRTGDMFEVVEHEQQASLTDVLREVAVRSDLLGNRRQHQPGLSKRRQVVEIGSVLVFVRDEGRRLKREPSLSAATDTRDRDKPDLWVA